MARVLSFPDGTTEVFLYDPGSDAGTVEVRRILQERLGDEMMELFHETYGPEDAPDDYEMACDSYRSCLQDVLDELRHVLNLLEEPRINRKKITYSIERVVKTINNEL